MKHEYSVMAVFGPNKKDRVSYRVFRDGVAVARVKTLRMASIVAVGMSEEDNYQ